MATVPAGLVGRAVLREGAGCRIVAIERVIGADPQATGPVSRQRVADDVADAVRARAIRNLHEAVAVVAPQSIRSAQPEKPVPVLHHSLQGKRHRRRRQRMKLDRCCRDESNVDDGNLLRSSKPASRQRGKSGGQCDEVTAPPLHTPRTSLPLAAPVPMIERWNARVDGDPGLSANRTCDDRREHRDELVSLATTHCLALDNTGRDEIAGLRRFFPLAPPRRYLGPTKNPANPAHADVGLSSRRSRAMRRASGTAPDWVRSSRRAAAARPPLPAHPSRWRPRESLGAQPLPSRTGPVRHSRSPAWRAATPG